MVMERVHGVLISDMAELQRRGANIQRLAENGVEIFFTQAFRHNFFHADMHPGNIFVLLDDPQHPRYAAVDFGIVGSLDPRDQHYLAENFLAFFERDYRRIAQLHIDSGWIPAHVRVDELESAVRTVCEPIANKPLREISFGQVLISLFEAAQRFDAQMQPQLMLIQKTLLQIEGVGRQLYPELDLWKTAQPLLRQWMAERWSLRAIVKDVRAQLPDMLQALRQLPPLAENIIQRASDGRFSLPVDTRNLEQLRREMREDARRRDVTIIAATAVLSSVMWLALDGEPTWPAVLVAARRRASRCSSGAASAYAAISACCGRGAQQAPHHRQHRYDDDQDRHDAEVLLDDRHVAEQVAAPQEQRDPGDAAGEVVRGEARAPHAADAGDERRERADDRNEARQHDGLAAVLLVERLGAVQVGPLQPADVAAECAWPDGPTDAEVRFVAERWRRPSASATASPMLSVPVWSTAASAPSANSSESPGRNGVTTRPVSQNMIANTIRYTQT